MTKKAYRWRTSTTSSKYNSTRVSYRGISFQSILERDYYVYLEMLQKSGEIDFFLQQSRFDLEGGVVYRLDFMVFHNNGLIEFVDVKGYETEMFKLKKKQVEARYNISISIVKRKDFSFKYKG